MLVLDPQKRIEWTELYVHPWVYDNKLGNIIDKRDLTITLNRSFYENLIKEKKVEEVKEQPEYNFDSYRNRYLNYRNIISHLIYVLEKGWFKFQDISYNFGLFVFAKSILFLYQQLLEALKNKTNKYNLGNFENFILTDDYKEIFKVVNLGFDDYEKYYSLYSMQLDDLNVNASNELFNRLKKFCSPNNIKFERNEYDYLIYRYLSKWEKIINNEFDKFKFFWMFLDCIEWKEIFCFDENNQTGFNFSDYRNKIEEIDKNQFDINIMMKRIESINKKINDNLI